MSGNENSSVKLIILLKRGAVIGGIWVRNVCLARRYLFNQEITPDTLENYMSKLLLEIFLTLRYAIK